MAQNGGKRPGAGRPPGAIPRVRPEDFGRHAGDLTPLEYMLAVMRDPEAHPIRRDEMAKSAAQYMHAKPSADEQPGKKEQRRQVAAERTTGRYAPPPPPKLPSSAH